MQFWYMQLHPGEHGRGEFSATTMKQMVLKRHLVGVGSELQWRDGKTYQIDTFRHEVQIGDIIMCADGREYLALVRVVGDFFDRTPDEFENDPDECWFGVARKVEILSSDPKPFETLYDAEHGVGASKADVGVRLTLCHWHKNKFIEFWYEQVMRGAVPPSLAPLKNKLDLLDETERRSEINQRRGQQEIRNFLLNTRHSCEVTGLANPQLLRASHIKAWRDSTNQERLDPENVLLIAANYDAAFDKHLISFNPNTGAIVRSDALSVADMAKMGIRADARIPTPSPRRKEYLEWHNRRLAQGMDDNRQ